MIINLIGNYDGEVSLFKEILNQDDVEKFMTDCKKYLEPTSYLHIALAILDNMYGFRYRSKGRKYPFDESEIVVVSRKNEPRYTHVYITPENFGKSIHDIYFDYAEDFINGYAIIGISEECSVLRNYTNGIDLDDSDLNNYPDIFTNVTKYNFIDKSGEVISKIYFDEVENFNEARLALVKSGPLYKYIDIKGETFDISGGENKYPGLYKSKPAICNSMYSAIRGIDPSVIKYDIIPKKSL